MARTTVSYWSIGSSITSGPRQRSKTSIRLNPELLAGSRYWVYLGAHVPVSYIGWYGVGERLHGPHWRPERNVAYPRLAHAEFLGAGVGAAVTALH